MHIEKNYFTKLLGPLSTIKLTSHGNMLGKKELNHEKTMNLVYSLT